MERLRRALAARRPGFEWLAVVPLVLAAVRAFATDWIPVGENAVISLRARDVLTGHHPWLGTASSSSVTSGTTVSHPGPLVFDLFALPVRLLGEGAGLVLGALLLHGAAVLVAGAAARRVGGERLVVLTTLAFIALQWTLGPELMLDPWNPHLVLMPFLAFLVCVTAVAGGHATLLVPAVAFGSFVLQTHVSYVVLVPVLGVAAAAACWWRQRGAGHERRPWALAGAVWLLLWAQPLWQQFFGSGPGNLSLLLRSGGEGEQRVGAGLAVRLVAEVVAVPRWWARPSFDEAILDMPIVAADGGRLPSPDWLLGGAAALLALALVCGVLGALAWQTWRRGHPAPAIGALVALAGVLLAVVTVAIVPAAGYGIAPHQVRWLWPLSLWWMVAAAWALLSLLPAVVARVRSVSWLAPAAAAVGVALCVPSYPVPVGVARAPGSMDSVRSISDQMESAAIPEAVFDPTGMWIGEPYGVPVIAALLRNDQPIRVAPDAAAQYGTDRVADADVQWRLSLRNGAAALVCADADRLALDTPWSDEQVADYRTLQGEVVAVVSAAVAADAALADSLAAAPVPLVELLAAGELPALLAAAGVELPQADAELLARFEASRSQLNIDTVAVFVRLLSGDYGQGCD